MKCMEGSEASSHICIGTGRARTVWGTEQTSLFIWNNWLVSRKWPRVVAHRAHSWLNMI